jgi:hypothetical protein
LGLALGGARSEENERSLSFDFMAILKYITVFYNFSKLSHCSRNLITLFIERTENI